MATKNNKKQRDEMFDNGFLWCSSCKSFYRFGMFYKYGGESSTRQYEKYSYVCKNCKRSNSSKNRTDATKEKMRNRYRKIKSYFVEKFGGSCLRCGFSDGIYALEFHHIFPRTKNESVSKVISSGNVERAEKELDKCIMLCSNCHKTLDKTWFCLFEKADFGYRIARAYE